MNSCEKLREKSHLPDSYRPFFTFFNESSKRATTLPKITQKLNVFQKSSQKRLHLPSIIQKSYETNNTKNLFKPSPFPKPSVSILTTFDLPDIDESELKLDEAIREAIDMDHDRLVTTILFTSTVYTISSTKNGCYSNIMKRKSIEKIVSY